MIVSIIVPVSRNEEPWLAQALTSINVQTYKDIELIVETDPKATGAAATRNRGLAKANGEFIAFCDADDYIAIDAIERMVNVIGDADMVAGAFRKFGDFEMVVNHTGGAMTMRDVAHYVMSNLRNPRQHQMLSGCWAKLYRRELAGRFHEHLTTAEDMAFNFDYLTRCTSVVFLPEVVYHNRKRPQSLTTTFNAENKLGLLGFLSGLKYVRYFLSGFYKSEEIEDALDNSKMYHCMLYFMRICAHTGKPMKETFLEMYP